MAHVTDWIARLVGGREVRRSDAGLLKSIAPGTLESVEVATDHPRIPLVRVTLDPSKGHHAHVFTRVFAGTGDGWAGQGSIGVPVIEIVPDPAEPNRAVRVCLMPDGSLLVSTKDAP